MLTLSVVAHAVHDSVAQLLCNSTLLFVVCNDTYMRVCIVEYDNNTALLDDNELWQAVYSGYC